MPFQFRKEAIEEDLNTNFPSQGQGNPPLYYSLSEVVVPTYSINAAAEGSNLGENLQTAWDFSTGYTATGTSATATLVNNTGFWRIQGEFSVLTGATLAGSSNLSITDGLSTKKIWEINSINIPGQSNDTESHVDIDFVVFLRSGDSLTVTNNNSAISRITYRQIATVNGTLVNPLGFSFA